MKPKNVLLVHLVANGDCLMATTVARQIKSDFPGCRLTWAIGYKCRSMIDNNPYVDAVWEVRYGPGESPAREVWRRVRCEAEARKAQGEFDDVFYTQIYPDNISNYDGTTRPSTFRCYPHPITVPVSPVVCLREQEVERARRFVGEQALASYRHVVLLECAPGSGQSALSLEKGIALAQRLVQVRDDLAVIVSSHLPFVSPDKRILDGSVLSLRENAALSHACTLFVGCSSGITWLLTSEAANPLPMVLFLSKRTIASGFASVVYDFDYWKLPSDHILESDAEEVGDMAAIVQAAIDQFPDARKRYHRLFKPAFWDFLCFFDYHSFRGMTRIGSTLMLFVRRNHFSWKDALKLGSLFRIVGYVVKSGAGFLRRRLAFGR
jgi:hypothetical protein